MTIWIDDECYRQSKHASKFDTGKILATIGDVQLKVGSTYSKSGFEYRRFEITHKGGVDSTTNLDKALGIALLRSQNKGGSNG